VELHFRRLAIVDLDQRSDQPFGDPKTAVTVYNGEIYNAEDLRSLLSSRGHRFVTSGDTEVIHVLLQQPDWLQLLGKVDGMYAFVVVSSDGWIRYGRDRSGIKPLYEALSTSGRLLGLASAITPLREAGVVREVDTIAVAAAAMFLWVPPPATGWRDCQQVEPGSVVSVRVGGNERRVSWLPALEPGHGDIRQAVQESLFRQVQADVPVALLLSGGLDSSWLAYELADMGIRMPFLSARFVQRENGGAEPFEEDAPYAERIAQSLGQSPIWLDLDERCLRHIPSMVDTVEQPFGDPAAITLRGLCDVAARHAKVVLSGIGVEEIFLGYERYQAIKVLSRMGSAARKLGSSIGDVMSVPASRFRERTEKFERMLSVNPEDWAWVSQSYYGEAMWRRLFPDIDMNDVTVRHREEICRARDRGATPLETAAHVDRHLFLPGLNLQYSDRASMPSSVELRVPFLGDPVLRAAATYSAAEHVGMRNGKRLFRAAARDAGVPNFILRRSKTGFGAPVRSIFRDHGSDVWAGIQRGAIFDDLMDRETVRALFEGHVSGREDHGLRLFGLCSLAVWWESHMSGDGSVREFLSASNF
jgi:asparagine synthase (glutamine-hydrolysing)